MKCTRINPQLKTWIACLLCFLLLPHSGRTETPWRTDYEAARQLAIRQEVPLVVFFTGSDWCVWCAKLEAEFFSSPQFLAAAENDLIAVKVDFPRRKHLPLQLARQNRLLKERFGVKAFPTVLWLEPVSGKVLRRHGYIDIK
jgi:protein disulfide-isomerase